MKRFFFLDLFIYTRHPPYSSSRSALHFRNRQFGIKKIIIKYHNIQIDCFLDDRAYYNNSRQRVRIITYLLLSTRVIERGPPGTFSYLRTILYPLRQRSVISSAKHDNKTYTYIPTCDLLKKKSYCYRLWFVFRGLFSVYIYIYGCMKGTFEIESHRATEEKNNLRDACV